MGRISALTELTSLASNDYIVVLDSSANIAKKITVANAFGTQDFGWTAAGESWTYSSWDSARRQGVITVPTDATTKYYKAMRIKITQSTGGTKYGIIVDVSATTLTIFFPSGTTLNNEAITSPSYSLAKIPTGFNADATQWSLQATKSTTSTQSSPTAGTIYNPGGFSLDVGKGSWYVEHLGAWATGGTNGGDGGMDIYCGLSTGASTRPDDDFEYRNFHTGFLFGTYRSGYKLHTSNVTYYAVISSSQSTGSFSIRGEAAQTTYGKERNIIRATCAYL